MGYMAISENQRLYSADSIIVEEGNIGDEMFILNEGKLGQNFSPEFICALLSRACYFM